MTQQIEIPRGQSIEEPVEIRRVDGATGSEVLFKVQIHLKKNAKFSLKNYDLCCVYHVDINSLEKTGLFHVVTPFGRVKFELPKGIQDGQEILVPGRGVFMDPKGKRRGDLRITVRNTKKGFLSRWIGGLLED